MDVQTFLDNVQNLTDLELAVLLSLIAQQHCLISTEDDLIDEVANELSLIVSEIFGLSYIVLEPEDLSSINKFGEAILQSKPTEFLEDEDAPSSLRARLASVTMRTGSVSIHDEPNLDRRMVVNVIIAKGFNLAHQDVQIQALELIQKKRIFSRTTVHPAPKSFLFIPLIAMSSSHVRLNGHLNDRIFISHYHRAEDGFANLEELGIFEASDQDSLYSLRRTSHTTEWQASRRVDSSTITSLRSMGDNTSITAEVRRYMQNIVVFLRMDRGVDGGVSPYATTCFVALAKYLAPLHGIHFVTPSLVALAARKIYSHRIIIAAPDRERSMQYGSTLAAVKSSLQGLTSIEVIEEVLNTVQCPV